MGDPYKVYEITQRWLVHPCANQDLIRRNYVLESVKIEFLLDFMFEVLFGS